MSYAEEIFSLGGEMEEVIRNVPDQRPLVFKVGITEVVPKSIAYRLLAPAFQLSDPLRIVCREGPIDNLLTELALHRIDLVIADAPMPSGTNLRGFNHHLGDCGVTFFAASQLTAGLSGEFPQCLDDRPLLLPGETTLVRNRLLKWIDRRRLRPRIVGEFDDSALMKAFGRAGTGIFIAPTPIADEIADQYEVVPIGKADDIRDHFYAISVERRISHPAIAAITEAAGKWLGMR